tara:strand:- start:1102 stop:2589 length:1488 start_codon:yes stop_codon:yes gene_type:complete
MSTILGANTLSSGYDVANSARFNDGGSQYLERNFSTTQDSRRKFTVSAWVKRGTITSSAVIWGSSEGSGEGYNALKFESNNLQVLSGNTSNSGTQLNLDSNARFEDSTGWYHIVYAVDTTQGTNTNRAKLYVNGTQVTDFGTATYPDQNTDLLTSTTPQMTIGMRDLRGTNANFWDGYICEVVFVDNQQLDPTSFGEFDEDSPTIWKPKSISGLTFGTNGFYLEFKENGTSQNSSGLGADTSGNDQHFSISGLDAQSQSLDTCTNNYATFLGETMMRSNSTFTNGNLKYNAPASNPVFGSLSTFGVESGKWYAEVKYLTGSNHYLILGIADEVFATLSDLGSATNTDLGKTGAALGSHPVDCTIAYVVNTGAYRTNNNNISWGSGGGDGDIINIALDRDNRKVYFGVNGTYGNSSDPAAGSNGIDISSLVTGDTYFLGVTNDTGASETTAEFNFGAGATTAISSTNADANGHGNFEYAVPSGFYAWNTKNLAEFG